MCAKTEDRQGLFLLLPREIQAMEGKFAYSLFSAIANFLAVAGLFLGISLFGCIDLITSALSKIAKIFGHVHNKCACCKIVFMVLLCTISACIVVLIIIVFIRKYASFPTETNVTFDMGIPPVAVTFCDSKYIFLYQGVKKEFKNLTDNLSFWEDNSDIRKKISSFAVIDSVGKKSTVWNSSYPKILDGKMFSPFIFPLSDKFLQFCHIHDLQAYPDLAKVIV
jgi:hypothetical protein